MHEFLGDPSSGLSVLLGGLVIIGFVASIIIDWFGRRAETRRWNAIRKGGWRPPPPPHG